MSSKKLEIRCLTQNKVCPAKLHHPKQHHPRGKNQHRPKRGWDSSTTPKEGNNNSTAHKEQEKAAPPREGCILPSLGWCCFIPLIGVVLCSTLLLRGGAAFPSPLVVGVCVFSSLFLGWCCLLLVPFFGWLLSSFVNHDILMLRMFKN